MKNLFFLFLIPVIALIINSCANSSDSGSESQMDQALDQQNSTDNSTDNSNVTSDGTCYRLENSTVDNSTVDNSTITDNSSIKNSTVTNCSTITSSTVDNSSTINESTVTSSTINTSVVDNGSNVCLQSTIDNTTLDNATVCNSSTVQGGSTISSSTVDNSSTVNNSTVCLQSTIDNSTIDNATICNNSIVQGGSTISSSNVSGSSTIQGGSTVRDNSTVCNAIIDNSTIDNSTVCYGSVRMTISNRDLQNQILTETDAPFISSISPADSASVNPATNISITFSEVMDSTSITTNTENTSCTGTIQISLSSSNFSSCIKMTASSPYTSDNEIFTVDPYDNLTNNATYIIRVTTGVKDLAGNPMSSDNSTGTGWTTDGTAPSAPIISGTTPTNNTTPTWSWSSGGGGNGTYRYKLDDSDLTSGATQTTSTSYTPGSGISEASHILYVQERDAAGNWSSSGSRTIVIDNTAPESGGVTISGASGVQNSLLNAGDVVSVTATFDENVSVGGIPQLTLIVGSSTDRAATYTSGSGSTSLVFQYTIQAEETDTDGISIGYNALALNSGTISDGAGNNATLTHSAVSANSSYMVDTTAPTVSGGIAISGASGVQNNLLNAGDVVSVTATFDENVSVTGTPQLTLVVGSDNRTAAYASGSGGTTLVFTYTIQAGETDSNGISIEANVLALNSGTISDAAGNNATLTHSSVADNSNYMVDTTAPTATWSAATDNVGTVTGALTSGDTTDDTALVLSGTNESGSSVMVYNSTTELGAATVSGNSWSYSATVANGTTYQFNVKGTDPAGNTSAATSNFAVTGDTTAPTANFTLSSETTTKIEGTTTSTVGSVSVNGLQTNATWQFSATSGNTWTGNITGSLYALDAGAYSQVKSGGGRAKQTDQAGNTSAVSTGTSTLSAINCSGISVTLAKIDDDSEVYVNGTVRASKGFSGTSQETAITSHLVTGENKIVFKLINGSAGYAYTYKVKKDSTYLFDETCGVWNQYGCNSDSYTSGLVVEIETTIKCE